MKPACVRQRAGRLEEQRATRETERCVAAEFGIEPEVLRGEAIALVERFAEAGVTGFAEKVARVAEDLAMPVEELRREVDEAAARCQ